MSTTESNSGMSHENGCPIRPEIAPPYTWDDCRRWDKFLGEVRALHLPGRADGDVGGLHALDTLADQRACLSNWSPPGEAVAKVTFLTLAGPITLTLDALSMEYLEGVARDFMAAIPRDQPESPNRGN